MGTTIREAVAADVPLILEFIRALAVFEREPDAVTATEADLLRDGFGEQPYYHCLIAEEDLTEDDLAEKDREGEGERQPAAFAFYFFNYSTWTGRPGLYLEDLYVHTEFRGRGIGKALLARVAAIAVEKNCPRLQWEVLDWNTPAVDFYRSLGADFLDEWRNVRMTGEALVRLAGMDTTADSLRE
jgi:ribosomal protein S18 acetylase RimI-like enzyme